MIKEKELLSYRNNVSKRLNKLECAIDNEEISYSKVKKLRQNYNIQLHLIDYILGKCNPSDLLLKDLETQVKKILK
ncbi:MAG TPA: hypothetical protein IAB27_05280 [Candidatus Coprosoma intestinipullorum]|uniref:Uncharacterized protein n=1 Tax=Candidatus Coprosoma intestinipullorum TaxID=2840752 RepID=A0A9D0ZTC5_9FIRM|nr:hypothetical protein [Candidatus Coprosoma intestinipullorum]